MPYMYDQRRANDACSCCPYGCTYVAPVILTVIAMILTWATTTGCYYYKSTFVDNKELLQDVTTESSFTFGPYMLQQFHVSSGGLITKEDDAECTFWPDHDTLEHSDLDSPLVFARSITMIITMFVTIFFIIFMFASCCVFQPMVLKLIMWWFIVSGVLYPLALVSMASEWCQDANDCIVQGHFVTVWFVFALWIAGGISILFMKERELPAGPQVSAVEMAPHTTTQVTERTIVEEDGTVVKVTTKTQIAPDGTQTVSETREVMQPGKQTRAVEETDGFEDVEIPVATVSAIRY